MASRSLVALALCLAALAALPSGASAQVPAATCEFDEATHTLSITANREVHGTTVVRDGALISVRQWSTPIDCAGPDATVTNTDTIDVDISRFDFHLSLAGGPLAPGYSAEADGDSEIETTVRGGGDYASIRLRGTPRGDTWRAGTSGGLAHVNFNATEAVGDADLVVANRDLNVELTGGADEFDAHGGAGTGAPLQAIASVSAGSGDDKLYGGLGGLGLYGDAGHDELHAASMGSRLSGGAGDDTLIAGPGEDSLAPGLGNDSITGTDEGGNDILDFEWDTPGVRYDMQVTGPQDTGEGTDTVPGGIEYVYGTWGPDVILGTAAPETILGDEGDDVLESRGGNDQLGGGNGWDVADFSDAPGPVTIRMDLGQVQAEHVIGSAFADVITGNRAANRIEAGGGADVVNGGLGSDVLDGGYGIDKVTYETRGAPVAIRLDGIRNDGADPDRDGFSEPGEEADHLLGFENATGGAAADTLFARSAGVNVLAGRGGADYLDTRDGSGNADVLNCGFGEDTYRSDPADTRHHCETAGP